MLSPICYWILRYPLGLLKWIGPGIIHKGMTHSAFGKYQALTKLVSGWYSSSTTIGVGRWNSVRCHSASRVQMETQEDSDDSLAPCAQGLGRWVGYFGYLGLWCAGADRWRQSQGRLPVALVPVKVGGAGGTHSKYKHTLCLLPPECQVFSSVLLGGQKAAGNEVYTWEFITHVQDHELHLSLQCTLGCSGFTSRLLFGRQLLALCLFAGLILREALPDCSV